MRPALRLLLPILVAALVLPACRAQSLSWRLVNAQIARRHPDVPQATTADLAARLGRGEPVVLLDARTPAEYAVSHLRGARRIDPNASADDIRQMLAGTPDSAAVVVYCSVGWRSGDLAARIQEAGRGTSGRGRVENLRGSIFAWANEGREVVTGAGDSVAVARLVHPFDSTWGRLLRRDLRAPID